MYYYLINNNGEYSDYSIHGLIVSENEITNADWQVMADGVASKLADDSETIGWWFIDDLSHLTGLLPSGANVVEYRELSLDARMNWNSELQETAEVRLAGMESSAVRHGAD